MAQPRITSVSLRNYKSIGHATVDLTALTILTGRNGAGKTNFCDAIQLVAEALQSTLEFAIRLRGGINEVRRRSAGHPTHFGISLRLVLASGRHAAYAFVIGATKDGGFIVQREKAEVGIGSLDDRAFYETADGAIVAKSSHTLGTPQIVSDRLLLPTVSAVAEFRELFDALSRMRFYRIDPNTFKQPQAHDPGEVLLSTGKNIASVIRRLQEEDAGSVERIQDYMKQIVPGLDRIEHEAFGPTETLRFAQKVQNTKKAWRFYAAQMSDGTLRSAGVLTALFQTHPRLGMPSLVCIEEPESTIHPGAAAILMDALIEASQRHQVIATTHSPDMLDNPNLSIDSIRVVENENGETRISDADEAAKTAVKSHLYTPGELLRQNQMSAAAAAAPRQSQLDLFKFE